MKIMNPTNELINCWVIVLLSCGTHLMDVRCAVEKNHTPAPTVRAGFLLLHGIFDRFWQSLD